MNLKEGEVPAGNTTDLEKVLYDRLETMRRQCEAKDATIASHKSTIMSMEQQVHKLRELSGSLRRAIASLTASLEQYLVPLPRK